MLTKAIDYLRNGLQVLPLGGDKRPLGAWSELQKRLQVESELTSKFEYLSKKNPIESIGIIAGKVSGSLEVIDVDCKYDLEGDLYETLKRLIDDNLPEIASSLVIGRTRSNGYHIYYRCQEIAGNLKLARRPASEGEIAKNPNERVKVLIETRGEGGYVVAPPTAGYQLIQGSLSSIPTLTPEQRNNLFTIARSFNDEPDQEPEPRKQYSSQATPTSGNLSPFADYNQRGDVVALLQYHGWSFVRQQGQRVFLKRPGQTDTKDSGNFHEGFRKLYVFSSSTNLSSEKPLSPSDVFITLECNEDKKEAYRKLLADGYGTAGAIKERISQVSAKNIRVEASNDNGEENPLTAENVLTEESIKSAVMESAFIYYTQGSPKDEVLQALALIERTSPVKVYLVEVSSLADTDNPIRKERPSEFKARDIRERYAEVYEANGDYMDPDREDQFIEEFIAIRQALTDPFEIERFRALWLLFSEANSLNITLESIKAVEEKLAFNKQAEEQSRDFAKMLEDAEELHRKGDISKALELLDRKSKEVSLKSKTNIFAPLTKSVQEKEFADRLSKRPNNIKTKYIVKKQPLTIPTGAITVVAAPTSHGKTTFLLNLALSVADEMPDKAIYVLGYEEDTDSMIVSAMSIGVGMRLSADNRGTIKSYYKGEAQYITKGLLPDFEKAKSTFFKDYIEDGRLVIQYIDYDSDTLCDFLYYLHEYGNAGAVFIDYMQLLHKGNQGKNKYGSRQLELQQICLDLKDVSVKTKLPLVLAAQFNRSVLNPAQLLCTNIREAADIEQIANLVIGLWNNDQNHKMKANEDDIATMNLNTDYNSSPGQIYLEILKNRGGKVGLAQMFTSDLNTGVIENTTLGTF